MNSKQTYSVSVIIPTFNRSTYIAEALDSILAQSLPPLEIIVVDDGSTDETRQVLEAYQSRIDYIYKENGGKSSALNLALPKARGDFIWIFDDDDFAYPQTLARHIELHEARPGLGFSFGSHDLGITGADGRIQRTGSAIIPRFFDAPPALQRIHLMRYCAVMLSACIIRKETLTQVGPFRTDLHRSQDYEMLIRLSQAADFAYTGEPTYILRKHEGVRGPAAHLHDNSDRRRVWRKYDRLIGESMLESIPIECYLPNAKKGPLPLPEHRAALIRRAWVLASKAKLDQVIADLLEAGALGGGKTPLSPDERECCQSLCDHEYFLMSFLEDQADLHPLAGLRGTRAGTEILRALGTGLYWKARERESGYSKGQRFSMLRTASRFLLQSAF